MRLFRGAPFHEGLVSSYRMAEAKVVVRYWIVSAILAAFCLVAIKSDNCTCSASSIIFIDFIAHYNFFINTFFGK